MSATVASTAPDSGGVKTIAPLSITAAVTLDGSMFSASVPCSIVTDPPRPLTLETCTVPGPLMTRAPPPSAARPFDRAIVCPEAGSRLIWPEPSRKTLPPRPWPLWAPAPPAPPVAIPLPIEPPMTVSDPPSATNTSPPAPSPPPPPPE